MVKRPCRSLVWDLPVRVGHWLLAISFFIAYLTSESERWRLVHVTSGAVVLAIVSFRLLWGIVGSHHARFSSFVTSPRVVLRYLSSLRRDEHEVYVGHNPAGGWSVMALLACCLATTLTGLAIHNAWPILGNEDVHEWMATLCLCLIGLHLAGVLLSSLVNRENLVRAMLTGYKCWATPAKSSASQHWPSMIALLLWIGAMLYWINTSA